MLTPIVTINPSDHNFAFLVHNTRWPHLLMKLTVQGCLFGLACQDRKKFQSRAREKSRTSTTYSLQT